MACRPLLGEEDLCRFRTKPCKRLHAGGCEFGSTRCQYSHDRYWSRRCPVYVTDHSCLRYVHRLCPDVRLGGAGGGEGELSEQQPIDNACMRGGECPFAHSLEELLYHPLTYKTEICRHFHQGHCGTYYCPFVHGLAERRRPREYKLPFTAGVESEASPARRLLLTRALPFALLFQRPLPSLRLPTTASVPSLENVTVLPKAPPKVRRRLLPEETDEKEKKRRAQERVWAWVRMRAQSSCSTAKVKESSGKRTSRRGAAQGGKVRESASLSALEEKAHKGSSEAGGATQSLKRLSEASASWEEGAASGVLEASSESRSGLSASRLETSGDALQQQPNTPSSLKAVLVEQGALREGPAPFCVSERDAKNASLSNAEGFDSHWEDTSSSALVSSVFDKVALLQETLRSAAVFCTLEDWGLIYKAVASAISKTLELRSLHFAGDTWTEERSELAKNSKGTAPSFPSKEDEGACRDGSSALSSRKCTSRDSTPFNGKNPAAALLRSSLGEVSLASTALRREALEDDASRSASLEFWRGGARSSAEASSNSGGPWAPRGNPSEDSLGCGCFPFTASGQETEGEAEPPDADAAPSPLASAVGQRREEPPSLHSTWLSLGAAATPPLPEEGSSCEGASAEEAAAAAARVLLAARAAGGSKSLVESFPAKLVKSGRSASCKGQQPLDAPHQGGETGDCGCCQVAFSVASAVSAASLAGHTVLVSSSRQESPSNWAVPSTPHSLSPQQSLLPSLLGDGGGIATAAANRAQRSYSLEELLYQERV